MYIKRYKLNGYDIELQDHAQERVEDFKKFTIIDQAI